MKFENKIPAVITIGGKDVNKIKIGGEVVWEKKVEPVDADYLYIENTYNGTNTISVKQTLKGSPDSSLYAKTLQYSKDKTNWSTITLSSTAHTITLNQGEKVYFRGNEGVLNYYANDGAIQAVTNILGTQSHTIGGNINTLVNYITPNELTLTQGVFAELFQNNTTITSAENLTLQPSSDDSLPTFAYYLMFSGCSALITSPSEIPATKQGHASCGKMFLDCIQLKTPPALKSTILGNYCYQALFKGCSALTTPPTIIPAKTAPYLSCHRMFNDCSSLITAPELPATTIGSGAYQYMFMGCSSLQTAPSELPAETLALNSYYEMFRDCSQLTTAPTIKAKTFAENSCQAMFLNCSSLNSITVYADDISATNCTSSWLNGVASSGTFNNMGSATYLTDSVSGIPTGWTEVKPDYLYIENTYNGTNNISVKQTITGSPDSSLYAKTLQYSKDKTNWSTITLSSTAHTITLNKGEKVYFRGNEGVLNYWYSAGAKKAIINILGTQSHTIGGNINTLLNYYTPNNLTLSQGVFNSLFENDTNLTSSSDIILPPPSNGVLPSYAYLYLFKKCTNMITTLSELPSVKQGEDSCNGMFAYTAITTAPALPSLELAKNCYYSLFEGCSQLVNPPALPATEMAQNCYRSLFYGCSSLVNPPELPAEVLVEGCYQNIFKNCTSLNNITVYANDISAKNCTSNWLSGVASTGTFNNYGDATYTINSASGIPSGWVEKKPNEPDYFYVENTHNGNNNIYVKTRAHYKNTEPTGEFATTLEYSKDKTNWTTINLNYDYDNVSSSLVTNLTLSLSVGEKVYFRNTSGYFGYVDENYGTHSHQFSSDENIKVGGNIKSLLDYRDMVGTTMKKGCFYEMFFEAYTLRDASELILPDTVADSCYLKLFSGCVYLTSIPSLPALTMAPNCYCEMFKNTAITTPPALPSTNLAEYCYKNMLEGTPITTAPALPATTLSVGCYQGLFNSCNKLTTAPILPATILVDYCYRYLFNGCLKLNSITTYANNINAEECTRWWLGSVASSGTLHNLGSATYVTDSDDGIPVGWTEVKS